MLGYVLRAGCGVLLLLLAVVIAIVLALLAAAAPAHAAPWAGEPVRLVAARTPAPPAESVRGEFFRGWASIPVPATTCRIVLAGDAAGRRPFAVDDRLTLIAMPAGGGEHRWQHDFGQGGRIVPLAATDVTVALGTDLTSLTVVLEDLAPPTLGNTDLWLLPCANGAPPATVGAMAPLDPPATGTVGETAAPFLPPAAPPGGPAGSGHAPGGDPLVGPLVVGVVGGAAGAGLLLWYRARRHRVVILAGAHLLAVYDPASGQQLQQLIHLTQLPLAIRLNPLEVGPRALPGAVCALGVRAPGAEPVVLHDPRAGPVPDVLLDGRRVRRVADDGA